MTSEIPLPEAIDWSDVRGFNYQPSFGATATEIWVGKYDADAVRNELRTAKELFPGMNAVRLWLSHDPFILQPEKFMRNFKTTLDICLSLGLRTVPAIFNNWHSIPDFGGVCPEMINYWFKSHGKSGAAPDYVFRPYFETLFLSCDGHEALLAWDICNEPFNSDSEAIEPWLLDIYASAKRLGVRRPLGVSVAASKRQVEKVADFSDVIMIHPYFANSNKELPGIVRFAAEKGKPLLATECCWGALDDARHVEIIRDDLEAISSLKLGFMPHALYESPVADLHRPAPGLGPLSGAECMAFVNFDGSLRKGHGIFNDYCRENSAAGKPRKRLCPDS